MIKDLIEVKQIPIIEEQLKNVSAVIDERVKNATSLVCTEETVKTIKELRADLNKDFKEFETKRKEVKEQVLKPYNDYNYTLFDGEKTYIKNIYQINLEMLI